jgi:hypothetical protein
VSADATHPNYNCRALGPGDSMMSNQNDAYAAVKAHDILMTCSCSADDHACGKAIAKAVTDKATACPAGSTRGEVTEPAGKGNGLVGGSVGWDGKVGRVITSTFQPAKRDSLLLPAQFRAITQPGCRSVNRNYYDCASQAYVTSRGNFGGASCATDLPLACRGGVADWLMH